MPQTIGSFTPVFEGAAAARAATADAAPAPPARAGGGRGAGRAGPTPRRSRRDGARVRSADARSAPARRQGGARAISATDGGAQLHRRLRHRPGAHVVRAVHAQRARAAAGARRAWRGRASSSIEQRGSAEGATAPTAGGRGRAGGGSRRSAAPAGAAASAPRPATRMLAQMEARMIRRVRGASSATRAATPRPTACSRSSTRCARCPAARASMLFSEGLAIPPAVQRLFLGVIDAANRANVSIYTMDAAGLRAESEQAKIRDQVNQAAGGGGGILGGGSGGGRAADEGAREERGRAAPGSAHRPRRARAEHRRPALRQHEQPAPGLRPGRDRPPQLLPRRLHAEPTTPTTASSATSRSR